MVKWLNGVISFSDVSFKFSGRQIINAFSEVINSGEHVCLMGESGSGKSTLLNSVVNPTFLDSGEIKVAGLTANTTNIQQIRSCVAWLPQNANLPYNSVLEMLKAPFSFVVNKHLQFKVEQCLALLKQVGLDSSLLNKELSTLSGGEKQRVSLISVLMLGRKILLLDEPTSALDNASRDKVINLLNSLKDTTILAITHDEMFAKSMNRIVILEKYKWEQ